MEKTRFETSRNYDLLVSQTMRPITKGRLEKPETGIGNRMGTRTGTGNVDETGTYKHTHIHVLLNTSPLGAFQRQLQKRILTFNKIKRLTIHTI